ncbi:ribonuclease H-like superfamily protein [Striga asiatica]|uniref:Ribonuclease H-like superfamily protein n=1 Tax=Striga asiatica TaxID=4170 RepID=A0A5A7P724_STRAF|nr:ribonuclease H-like superfamily protein [Striga asiatica]
MRGYILALIGVGMRRVIEGIWGRKSTQKADGMHKILPKMASFGTLGTGFWKPLRPVKLGVGQSSKALRAGQNGLKLVAYVYSKLVTDKWSRLDIAEKNSEQEEAICMRKRRWKLRIKGKIRHFIWRCVGTSTMSWSNLATKGVIIDPICKIYGEEPELQILVVKIVLHQNL